MDVKEKIGKFDWKNRVPVITDAFALAGTMLFATLFVYEIFDLDLAANAGSFLFVGLSFFLFGVMMLVMRSWRRVMTAGFVFWIALSAFDIWLRTFLKVTYNVPADSPMILQSLANTQSDEFREGFLHTAPWVFVCIAAAVCWFALGTFLSWNLSLRSRRASRHLKNPPPLRVILAFAGTAALFFMHFVPSLRAGNPAALWIDRLISIEELQEQTDNFDKSVPATLQRVPVWKPHYAGKLPRTVVLVFGESTNRENWSLYGYSRKTTPRLDDLASRGELTVFRDALSAAATTVPAFRRMLTVAEMRDESRFLKEPDLLRLARAAGYKIFWLSNQNDSYVRNLFSSAAHVSVFTNDGDGGNVSFDDVLAEPYQNALDDPAPLKLVVVHLMGAHPHYKARVPAHLQNAFARDEKNPDAVEKELLEAGRFDWIVDARNDYDRTMLFQDELISEMIEKLRSRGDGCLFYVSDHAQEVGHTRNFTGHDPNGVSGYTVPVIYWQNPGVPEDYRRAVESRPFQCDTLFWTLLHSVLKIETQISRPQDDVMNLKSFRPRKRFFEYSDLENAGG